MRIQEAITLCKKTKQYARPQSWKGQGRGVDLGQTLTENGVKVVQIINDNGALWGSDWNPTPEELMERWEIVDAETLWKENNRESDDQDQVR